MSMQIIHNAAGLPSVVAGRRRAVVMTMGALHQGHLSLVRAARERADEVLVTIFVNPLQFNDPRDLERYPRTLEADAALLRAEGVDLIYAPSVEDVYPGGVPIVSVNAGQINHYFEGVARPGHFDGVLTVVLKLMHLTRPDIALFGQKDAQQVIAVRTMCRDFNVPVEVVAVPTVRDADGLALSSRNVFLTDEQRVQALALPRALRAAQSAAHESTLHGAAMAVGDVLAAGNAVLAEAPGVEVEYLGALDPASAAPVSEDYRGEVVVAVAARVGATRLIDNVVIEVGGSA